jgi:hypothetical protein
MTTKFYGLLFIASLALVLPAQCQEASVDKVMADLYESISFSESNEPDYDKFQSLFVDGGRLISVKDTTSYTLTPQSYEQAMTNQRQSGQLTAFEETELHRTTDRYGNILHVFSTYQTTIKNDQGTENARGINSIQLMKKDGNWKVVSIIWYEENNAHPIPKKYLPEQSQ